VFIVVKKESPKLRRSGLSCD